MPSPSRSHAGSCALRVLRSAARRVAAALLLACLALATAASVAGVAAEGAEARTGAAATGRIAAAGDATVMSLMEAGPRAPVPGDDDGGCPQCACPCHGACPCALLRAALPTVAPVVPTVATAATARVLTRASVAPRGPAREPALRPPIARAAA